MPLPRALASSCSVPGVFPPVTISGIRYMDGGMRTALNADLAAGHDAVIAVSCMMLELPAGVSDPVFDVISAEVAAELAAVRDSGSALEVVAPGPEFLEISGWGASLMDPSRVRRCLPVRAPPGGRRGAATRGVGGLTGSGYTAREPGGCARCGAVRAA